MTAARPLRRGAIWATIVLIAAGIVITRNQLAEAGTSGVGIDRVYVAVGDDFPDALGAGPIGGAAVAPVIILPTDPPIPGPSQTELLRLDPAEVVIVGGTGVISTAMETALGDLLPFATITRLAGVNRYDTNAQLSESLFPIESWMSVPAAAFGSNNPDVHDVTLGASAYNNTSGFLLAPVYLPDNAEILQIKLSAYDTHGTLNLLVKLRRYDTTGLGQDVASISFGTSGGDYSVVQGPSNHARVDNENYSYQFEVYNADDDSYGIGVYNIMVKYRLGSP